MSEDIIVQETFEDKAKRILNQEEVDELANYLIKGGLPLAADTANKLFAAYLNSVSIDELCQINKAYPRAAINHARVKYNWDEQKDHYVSTLMEKTKEKVIKAQLETTGLVSDLLMVASRKHGDRIRKYFQTGDESVLGKELNIDSITNLIRLSEVLLKLTGQDKKVQVQTNAVSENNINVKVDTTNGTGKLSEEEAAKILEIIAESKRRKD